MTKLNVPFLDEIRNFLVQTDPEFLRTVISEQLHQLGSRCYRTHGCLQILAEPQSGQLPERAAQSTLRYARRDHRPPDSNVAAESYFAPCLQARKRSEAALISVVQQAYVIGYALQ